MTNTHDTKVRFDITVNLPMQISLKELTTDQFWQSLLKAKSDSEKGKQKCINNTNSDHFSGNKFNSIQNIRLSKRKFPKEDSSTHRSVFQAFQSAVQSFKDKLGLKEGWQKLKQLQDKFEKLLITNLSRKALHPVRADSHKTGGSITKLIISYKEKEKNSNLEQTLVNEVNADTDFDEDEAGRNLELEMETYEEKLEEDEILRERLDEGIFEIMTRGIVDAKNEDYTLHCDAGTLGGERRDEEDTVDALEEMEFDNSEVKTLRKAGDKDERKMKRKECDGDVTRPEIELDSTKNEDKPPGSRLVRNEDGLKIARGCVREDHEEISDMNEGMPIQVNEGHKTKEMVREQASRDYDKADERKEGTVVLQRDYADDRREGNVHGRDEEGMDGGCCGETDGQNHQVKCNGKGAGKLKLKKDSRQTSQNSPEDPNTNLRQKDDTARIRGTTCSKYMIRTHADDGDNQMRQGEHCEGHSEKPSTALAGTSPRAESLIDDRCCPQCPENPSFLYEKSNHHSKKRLPCPCCSPHSWCSKRRCHRDKMRKPTRRPSDCVTHEPDHFEKEVAEKMDALQSLISTLYQFVRQMKDTLRKQEKKSTLLRRKRLTGDDVSKCQLDIGTLLDHAGNSHETIRDKNEILYKLGNNPNNPRALYYLANRYLTGLRDFELKELTDGDNPAERVIRAFMHHGLTIGHLVEYYSDDFTRRDDILLLIDRIHANCVYCCPEGTCG